MMKSILWFFLLVILSSLVWGSTNYWVGIGDIDDAEISEGEYGYARWVSYDPPLVVNGGGAERIEMRDSGRLIVESTSTPLDLLGGTGVYDILLFDESQLLYKNGVTELIIVTGNGPVNNTAVLKGGGINYIKSMQHVTEEHIFIYAQDDWSWIDNNPLLGIQGRWLDSGTLFSIEFINDPDYDPVWMNVKIVPEPATVMLLGIGGLFLRRK